MTKERVYGLDLVRIVACLMVVVMHAPMPRDDGGTLWSLMLSTTNFATVPSIGLFFMVSGALLLPVRGDAFTWLKRRLGKVVGPTLAATAFYLAVSHYCGDGGSIVHEVLSLPFSPQGTGILWFMYTLIGLYLVAPVLSKWLSTPPSLTEINFYLCLWLVTMCYPLINLVADVNETNTGILYYFGGFLGYFVLGHVMMRYPQNVRWRWLLPLLAVTLAAPVVCKLAHWQVDFFSIFWYLSVFTLVMCAAWFKGLMQWGDRWLRGHQRLARAVALVSNLTFGIYLIHFFVLRRVLWHCGWIAGMQNGLLQTAVLVVLTLLISVAASALLSMLPGGQYLTGYRLRLSKE